MSIRASIKIDNTPPTKRQWETLEYIVRFISDNGYAPSITEISKRFKVSLSTAFERVERIKRKGLLEKWKHAKRGMDITDFWDKRDEIRIFLATKPKPKTLIERIKKYFKSNITK